MTASRKGHLIESQLDQTRHTRRLKTDGNSSKSQAEHLGLGRRPELNSYIRPYRNGRDLTAHPRDVLVIDLFGLEEVDVRRRFPETYQHLAGAVKVKREAEYARSQSRDAQNYADRWWIFGKPRTELRPALAELQRYIVTVETAKHRVMQFLPAGTVPDNKLVAIASDDAFHLGVLSSIVHDLWALRAGGKLGVGNDPVYVKSRCFDPFPFPDASPAQRALIAALAEEIDSHRKRVLAEHLHLTLTGLYNVRERLRSGAHAGDLNVAEHRIYNNGLVLILDELHAQLDRAVLDAYGWPASLAESDLLARVVALNAARTIEERRGQTRWLRPAFQAAQSSTSAVSGEQTEADLLMPSKREAKALFPQRELDQMAAVLSMLVSEPGPKDAATIASRFRQGKKVEKKVAAVLSAVERTGVILVLDRGQAIA